VSLKQELEDGLTSIVVRLHLCVPANHPSAEHWSISTSCKLMSTRTTPLYDITEHKRERQINLLLAVKKKKNPEIFFQHLSKMLAL